MPGLTYREINNSAHYRSPVTEKVRGTVFLSPIYKKSRFETFALPRAQRAIDATLHVQQLGQLGAEGFVLGVGGVAFSLQRIKFTLPLGCVDYVGQLAAGEVELL